MSAEQQRECLSTLRKKAELGRIDTPPVRLLQMQLDYFEAFFPGPRNPSREEVDRFIEYAIKNYGDLEHYVR